jgi:stage II sporulation protein D
MNYSFLNSLRPFQQLHIYLNLQKAKVLLFAVFIILVFTIPSCAPAKFSGVEKEKNEERTETAERTETTTPAYIESVPVRVLVSDAVNPISFRVGTSVNVQAGQKPLALIKPGNRVEIYSAGPGLILKVNGQEFTSGEFRFLPVSAGEIFEFNGKKYRGSIIINSKGKIVNVVSLEDYLKGVLPAEMPAGKGNENFEALKAQAVCARTYTIMKLDEKKPDFDLYIDVRDQVYGGADSEKDITNKAVNATQGMILSYNGLPALVFYSASCGGYTETGGNVFIRAKDAPYLVSVKDGDDPYCSITPKFQWEEQYPHQEFINRFIKNGLINSGSYSVKSIEVKSRFPSGRVNELEIIFTGDALTEVPVSVFGNQIRSIIRTADNKGILRSTMFDISMEGENIIIKGRGNGHGVGLCQWGAISQSRSGVKFEEILKHYFPGTEIQQIN